jgi:Ca2+-binding RTX toxin-like protein
MRKRLAAVFAVAALAVGTMAMAAPAAHADEDHCDWDVTTILGTPQNDVLNGTLCRDLILGFNGDDVLRGKQGEDVLRGGRGNDRVIGVDTFFPESDQVGGGPGFDTCIGDILDNFLNCEVVIETT